MSKSFFEGGDGDVEDSAFGTGLELVVAVNGEIGACWKVGFVTLPCSSAEVVDGGVFFVAADAGIVAADLCGQAGGKLPAFLQGLASLVCGALMKNGCETARWADKSCGLKVMMP